MATYAGREAGVRGMGLGGLVTRVAIAGVVGWAGITGGQWAMEKIGNGNAPIEQGFVNYKALDIQGKKNASGNMEAYLQFKSGDNVESLPCMKGAAGGVLCGGVDYIVENFTAAQKEGVVVGQFQNISNDAKRGIVGGELQTMLDSFYGVERTAPNGQVQLQYQQPKK